VKNCAKIILLPILFLFLLLFQISAEENSFFVMEQDIEAGDLLIYFVDGSDEIIENPMIEIPFVETSFDAQSATGVLSNEDRIIRIENITPYDVLYLTLAPELNTGVFVDDARWVSGSNYYPIYSENVEDGSLEVDPSTASGLLDTEGCDVGDIVLASSASFLYISEEHENNVESIDLFSTNNGSFCRIDLKGIDLTQTVPPLQAPGIYELGMVLTITGSEIIL
jgi:hypothetical protein